RECGRVRDDGGKAISRGADFGAVDVGINQRGVAGGSVSDAERSSSYRPLALFTVRGSDKARYTNDAGVVSRRWRPLCPCCGSERFASKEAFSMLARVHS